MIPLWTIVYGLAWIMWLVFLIGGLGNTKLLSLCSTTKSGFTASENYTRGRQLAQMDGGIDQTPASL
jgi:hypothetical protein